MVSGFSMLSFLMVYHDIFVPCLEWTCVAHKRFLSMLCAVSFEFILSFVQLSILFAFEFGCLAVQNFMLIQRTQPGKHMLAKATFVISFSMRFSMGQHSRPHYKSAIASLQLTWVSAFSNPKSVEANTSWSDNFWVPLTFCPLLALLPR